MSAARFVPVWSRAVTVLVLCVCLSATARAQSGWGTWQPLNDSLDIRFKMTKFDFGHGQHEIYWQVRSRYPYKVRVDYLLSLDTDAKVKDVSETDTLNPGQGSSTAGSWTIGRSVTGFKVLKVTSLDGGGRAVGSVSGNSGSKHTFNRPSISGIQLEPGCLALLKSESEKLELAGATKKLLAWTPLITLAGESNAMHAAIFIKNTDWNELAESFGVVNKSVFISLAQAALLHANNPEHYGDPKGREFWKAMADFYAAQADR